MLSNMLLTKTHLMLLSLLFTQSKTLCETYPPDHKPLPTPSKHFVLVHGAGHGAWTWYKLVPLLRSSGHNVTAIELAASGIDPRQLNELESVSDTFKPLVDFMASLPAHERVILVGHSLGGFAISHSMENFPNKISVAVFVSAFMPSPSFNVSILFLAFFRTFGPQLDNRLTYRQGDNGPKNFPTTILFGPIYLSLKVYQHSPIQDWTLATTLVRPARLLTEEDVISRELVLTSQNYGSVKRAFIVLEEDLTITRDFQEWMIRNNPPNEIDEIKGSDHMAMMSKPEELWAVLLQIAYNKPS